MPAAVLKTECRQTRAGAGHLLQPPGWGGVPGTGVLEMIGVQVDFEMESTGFRVDWMQVVEVLEALVNRKWPFTSGDRSTAGRRSRVGGGGWW